MTTLRTAALAAATAATMMIGCSSSEESMTTQASPPPPPSATELLQKDLTDCRDENTALRSRAAALEQENRAAASRAADLESQLADLKAAVAPARRMSPVRDPRAGYESALTLFHTRNYTDAAASLQAMLDAGAPEDLEDNCEYWLGECAYAMKDYRGALAHFEKISSFSVSEKKDDAQMMIANSWHALGDRVRAKAEYEKLLDRFPASPYAKRAREKLSQL